MCKLKPDDFDKVVEHKFSFQCYIYKNLIIEKNTKKFIYES